MESDSMWIAARRIRGQEWQDVHVAPVTFEQSKRLVEQLRGEYEETKRFAPVRWASAPDGSFVADDDDHEYCLATIDCWMEIGRRRASE